MEFFIHVNTTYPVFSDRYRIIMVNVSGTFVLGTSFLLLQFVDECDRDILLTLLPCFKSFRSFILNIV